jgi:glutaredoxin
MWIDGGADLVNKLVPIVALVIGFGLINVLPKHVTKPFFGTEKARSDFFNQFGAAVDPKVPYVLVAERCKECDALVAGLDEAKIPYTLKLVTEDPMGQELYAKSQIASGSKNLPKVILGTEMVDPDLDSVKLAYSRVN